MLECVKTSAEIFRLASLQISPIRFVLLHICDVLHNIPVWSQPHYLYKKATSLLNS